MGHIEHGLEAAEAVVTAMQRENEGYVGPYDEWLPQTIQAYLDATNLAGAVEAENVVRVWEGYRHLGTGDAEMDDALDALRGALGGQ